MNQPNRLKLPTAYPGCTYQHDVALTGYQTPPTASLRLTYAPGGRTVGAGGPEPVVTIINDLSNPTSYKARIQAAPPTPAHAKNDYWLELIVDGDVHSAGPFSITYQTRP